MIGIWRKISYNKAMRTGQGLLLLLLSAFLVTCNTSGSSGFSATLSQNQVTIINSTTGACSAAYTGVADSSVGASFFILNNITISWNMKYPLTIQWVEFYTTDPNISNGAPFTAIFGGTDLSWAWQYNFENCASGACVAQCTLLPITFGGTANPNPLPGPPSSASCSQTVNFQSYCGFRVGGVSMTNPHQSAAGAMGVKIYATYDEGNGNIVPTIIYKTLSYQYQGI